MNETGRGGMRRAPQQNAEGRGAELVDGNVDGYGRNSVGHYH
jgi:hypothetical protein